VNSSRASATFRFHPAADAFITTQRMTRIFLLALAASALNLHAAEIIAHRGASRDAAENTLAAFKLAWKQQADAGELDIYMSKDREVVVIHDATTKRTAKLDKPVAAQTLAELRQLDAGSWKSPKWKGGKIPTLAEALATIPDGKRMFIEIKCGADVLPELERVLKASGKKPEQLVLISFKYDVMKLARERFPQLQLYWVVSLRPDKKTGRVPPLEPVIEKARVAKLDGLDLDYRSRLDAAAVAKIKAAGLKVYVWTVDDVGIARKLVAAGVDGITTNRPALLREQLR
jgi:glycerophosphoryl diester phosphodiesterase